ncbi:MAG: family 2 glycosyl transferase [Sulfitobacter sp.]
MRISVAICSVGRPDSLAAVLPWADRQSVPADEIVLAVTKPEDLPDLDALNLTTKVSVLFCEKGLPRQRNAALGLLMPKTDAIFFIDDDYMPGKDAVAGIQRAFEAYPEAGGFTGRLLADGIHTGGIPFAQAADLLTSSEAAEVTPSVSCIRRNLVGLYGCNMVYRTSQIGQVRFDERLPLYGWQEDVDFASRVSGEMIKTEAFFGVHCGVGGGRETSGHLLGYSQIANVVYLIRKGSLPMGFGLRLMARNIASNHAKILRPEDWVDRKGRARGNRLALLDVLRGSAAPERIIDMLP